MIIDFHTHIYPKKIRTNREKYFPSEPGFKLLYKTPKSKLVGAKALLDAMNQSHVDKSVIFGFPWKNSETFKSHNDYISEVVQQYPDRFIGLGCFDPSSKEAVREAERCLGNRLSGIGELAFFQYGNGLENSSRIRLEPIMKICRVGKLPVLIHTNEPVGHIYPGKTRNTLAQIYNLIRKFPENKIVLAHWGGGLFFFNLLKKEVKENLKNVYFDTAASPFLYDTKVYRLAIKLVGIEKILFGSDYPLLPPGSYFDEMKAAGLSKQEMEKICGGNATALFNEAV